MDMSEINVYGIKCDNPDCDYENMDVKYEEYPQWLNEECPSCGENLLTEEDLESTKQLVEMVKIANQIAKDAGLDDLELAKTPKIALPIEMDGTGKVTFGKARVLEE
ncbi:hypothetical protein [Candidatus Enterococcus ferrettii]|uniref:Uncharacterized protein n=1 Tax=Candidatus Enterococcus ferrettii TaxID=2815324 RepID=A0ABV0EKL8_9ENTE|nr:hypothetical protein [Enterococcus sp. 665A]MBO1341878.1 hypothetical protein [Enterococcus sp. 665A]